MRAKVINGLITASILLFSCPGGAMADTLWTEDFETYPEGTFPSPDWTYTGSSNIYVDSSTSSEGANSLRFHGAPGGCWESIPCRPLEVSTAGAFIIEFSVHISSDHVQGCHSWTGGSGLTTACSWMTGQGVGIVNYSYDGTIGSRIGDLGTYEYDTWHRVRMAYERLDDSSVRLSYWIDDDFKRSHTVSAASYEDDLLYFLGSSGDGTVRIDDIRVAFGEFSVIPSLPAEILLGEPFSHQLEAVLGVRPFSWSVVDGTLPPGMALSDDGVFSGTPSWLGESNFTVLVTDSEGAIAEEVLTVRVVLGPPQLGYTLTAGSYSSDSNFGQVCEGEFGPGSRLADWNEVVAFVASNSLDEFYSMSGMTYYGASGWVTRDGKDFSSGDRHYFVERHDGNVPPGWLVHDSIGDHDIDLGSWFHSTYALCATQQVLAVTIDIKPGSEPNSINLRSAGRLPIAILSTTSFNATAIDPATVTLASAPVRLKKNGTAMASSEDVNGDGLLDLVVHVSTKMLMLTETDTEAILEGRAIDGTRIEGADSVRLVP